MSFTVRFLMDTDETYSDVEILAVCVPGDNMEPVITIMLPEDE